MFSKKEKEFLPLRLVCYSMKLDFDFTLVIISFQADGNLFSFDLFSTK